MQHSKASKEVIEQTSEVTAVTVLHPEARPDYRLPDWAIFNQPDPEPEAPQKHNPFIDAWMESELFAR